MLLLGQSLRRRRGKRTRIRATRKKKKKKNLYMVGPKFH
jgi:hypothetical protein